MDANALPKAFDIETHRRLVRECLEQVPIRNDAEALERLGQLVLGDPDLAGGGGFVDDDRS